MQYDPFFWDTVQLASKHAHHFYENGLRWLPLPEEIDSGHPPLFGYYLALIWTLFGKTLPASHWAMLPFLMLNVWLLYRLGLRLGGEKWAFWLIPLVLLDPVMAGQSTLISPDVVLICGFLLAVEGILGNNKVFTAIGISTLCMVSVRGMMTAGALMVWIALEGFRVSGFRGFGAKNLLPFFRRMAGFALERILPFAPGFAFAIWFLWWHKAATGWIGLHPNSPWAPTFEPAKGLELARNLLVTGWRWLDFGRVFEWVCLGWLVWKFWPPIRQLLRDYKNPEGSGSLLLLLVCLIIFLSPSALLFKNVSAHRYFLPGFIALHLLFFQLSANIRLLVSAKRPYGNPADPRIILATAVIALASGNLWIYPRGVAMGWDATLAHQPYHRLRADAIAFLEENNIDFQTVGSAFPNLNTGENLMLNGDRRRFAEKDFTGNTYFFASNVYNDVTESDYLVLQKDWLLIKKWQHGGVWIEIYRRSP